MRNSILLISLGFVRIAGRDTELYRLLEPSFGLPGLDDESRLNAPGLFFGHPFFCLRR